MFYEKLCQLGGKVPPFSSLAERQSNRDLERALIFLKPLIKVNQKEVYSTAYFLSFLMFIAGLFISFILNLFIIISVPIIIGTTILVYYVILSYPVSLMNSYRVELSEESDIIFEQIILVFQSGGTIFDAIEMIAQSEHTYLSKTFQKILGEIDEGRSPESCLAEFAKNQPSDDLRRYFTAVLTSMERDTDLLDLLSGESFEADLALRQKNLELESRLLVLTALSTYIPIIVTLAIALGGMATNPIILILIPFFILIGFLMSKRFAHQFSAFFDRPRKGDLIGPTQKEIMTEYDEFLNFLMAIGERLKLGDTMEVALTEVRDDMAPEVQRLIDPAINAIYSDERSLMEAMDIASKQALGQRVSHMLKVITIMAEISAVNAGQRITNIAGRLVKRSAVVRERDSIIAAQRLKVYLLVITSSLVLGLMSSLAPFLGITTLFGEGTFQPGNVTLIEIAPLIITMIITSGSNGYQNTRMVGGERPILMGIICIILFWLAFSFAASVLGLFA
jgi:pilus assembly protein TadC